MLIYTIKNLLISAITEKVRQGFILNEPIIVVYSDKPFHVHGFEFMDKILMLINQDEGIDISLISVEDLIKINRHLEFNKTMESNKKDLIPSIIGMKYRPMDNSWAICLNSGNDAGVYGKVFDITSDPYSKTFFDKVLSMAISNDMIQVKSPRTGRTYEVLFRESWIMED